MSTPCVCWATHSRQKTAFRRRSRACWQASKKEALARLELRLQEHLRQMDQIRACLEAQAATCPQLHQNLAPSAQTLQRLEQAQNAFRAELHLIREGQQNTARFRHQVQNGVMPLPADTPQPLETPPAEPTASGVTPEALASPQSDSSAAPQQSQSVPQNSPNVQPSQTAPSAISPAAPHHTQTAQPPHGSNIVTPQAAQQQNQQQQQEQQNAPQTSPGGNGNGKK